MTKPNDGGPAFPTDGLPQATDDRKFPSQGMSKREVFAKEIMGGLCSNPAVFQLSKEVCQGWRMTVCSAEDLASMAADIADALIAELAKGEKG